MLILQSDYATMLLLVGPHMGHPKGWHSSPEGTRYHSSLRISRAVMNPEKPNLGHDSYGTWKERTWNQCFQLIQSELTSRDCVSNQLRILDKSPLRPHFSFRMRKRTFWDTKSYEHVRRDSQESPNGVNNACSRQKFFLPNNCSTVQASFLPNLKWLQFCTSHTKTRASVISCQTMLGICNQKDNGQPLKLAMILACETPTCNVLLIISRYMEYQIPKKAYV